MSEKGRLFCISFILISFVSPLNSLRRSPQPPPLPSTLLLNRQKLVSPASLFIGTFFLSPHWLPGPWWGVRGHVARCGLLVSSSLGRVAYSPHVPFPILGCNVMCYKLSENRGLLLSRTLLSKGKCGDLSCTDS